MLELLPHFQNFYCFIWLLWVSVAAHDVFIAEAEVPMLWPPGAKTQLIGKDPDAGKD